MFNNIFRNLTYDRVGASSQGYHSPSDYLATHDDDWSQQTTRLDSQDHCSGSSPHQENGNCLGDDETVQPSTALKTAETVSRSLIDLDYVSASSGAQVLSTGSLLDEPVTATVSLQTHNDAPLLQLHDDDFEQASQVSAGQQKVVCMPSAIDSTSRQDWPSPSSLLDAFDNSYTAGPANVRTSCQSPTGPANDSLICFDSPQANLNHIGNLLDSCEVLSAAPLSTSALPVRTDLRAQSGVDLCATPSSSADTTKAESKASNSKSFGTGDHLGDWDRDSFEASETPLADMLKNSNLASSDDDDAQYETVSVYVVPLFRDQFVVIPVPTEPPRQKPKAEWVQNIEGHTTKVQQKVQTTWESLRYSQPDSIKNKVYRFGTAQLEDLTPEQRFLGGIPTHATKLRIIHSSKINPQDVMDYMANTVKKLGSQQRLMQIGAAAALPFTFAIDSIIIPGPAILTGFTGYKLYHYTRAAEGCRHMRKFIGSEGGAADETNVGGELEFVVDDRLDKYHEYVLDDEDAVLEEDCISDLCEEFEASPLEDVLQQLRRRYLRKKGKVIL